MAEPTDPAEFAKVQAQDMYNATAVAIEDLLDDFPNPTWDSTKMDTWLIDAVSHLSICEKYWSPAGVTSKAWYKLEYSLITRVPDLAMDLVTFARTKFNELVERAVHLLPSASFPFLTSPLSSLIMILTSYHCLLIVRHPNVPRQPYPLLNCVKMQQRLIPGL